MEQEKETQTTETEATSDTETSRPAAPNLTSRSADEKPAEPDGLTSEKKETASEEEKSEKTSQEAEEKLEESRQKDEKRAAKNGKSVPGYISRYRRINIIWLVVWFLIGLNLFITGLMIWHTRANLLTVLAVLAVLPGAKRIVALIALGRKKSVEESRCRAVEAVVEPFIYAGDLDLHQYDTDEYPEDDEEEETSTPVSRKYPVEENVIYTDYIFTSTEKVMMLDFMVVTAGGVFILPTTNPKVKTDVAYIKKYLAAGIRKNCDTVDITVVKGDKELIEKLKEDTSAPMSAEDRYEVLAYLKSLAV